MFKEEYLKVRKIKIQILLAIVTHYDLKLEQLHINTIFLYWKLEEEIYMN